MHHFPGRWNVSAASRNHPPSSTCEDEDTPNKDENGEHDHDDHDDDDDVGNDAVGDTEGDDDDDADNDRMMVCAVECGGAGTANPPPV